nr:hypothetical protein [Mycoplasmopsis bovis]
MLKTIMKSRNQLLHQKTNQMNLESEAGKNDNVNTIPMNNDEEEKRKYKREKKRNKIRSCSFKKVLGTWNKDFKNDIWANWSYKDIFDKLKSKIPDINLQLVRDPGIKPKPNSDSTNPPFVIKLNDSSNEQVLPFGKVWPISSNTEYKGDEATSIGYNEKGVIEKFKESTNKVPQHLPKFISSLFLQHLKSQHKKKLKI